MKQQTFYIYVLQGSIDRLIEECLVRISDNMLTNKVPPMDVGDRGVHFVANSDLVFAPHIITVGTKIHFLMLHKDQVLAEMFCIAKLPLANRRVTISKFVDITPKEKSTLFDTSKN